jgi:hypothetical protein
MKKCIIALLIITSVIKSYAVAQSFPLNEAGKIAYYEVVEVDSMKKDLLYHNSIKWINHLKAYNHKIETTLSDSLTGKVMVENEFSVYSQSGILKKLVGKFTYSTVIEMKDNRYRYTFTDFVFHEYSPDRYHNILPTGKIRNLEEVKAVGSQKQWDKHRTLIANKIQQDIINLKSKMVEITAPVENVAPKKTVKWDE